MNVSKTSSLETNPYVSRGGLKLASVADKFKLDFNDKVVLDVGSSTGGFTDYALQHGAKQIIAVDKGTNQLHSKLRPDKRVELHEQTDIRNFMTVQHSHIDLVLVDVSFTSLQNVLPHIAKLANGANIVAMLKPQFEASSKDKHRGIVKNEKMRRNTLKAFENWVQKLFKIVKKADSQVAGAKGNKERFYLLKSL